MGFKINVDEQTVRKWAAQMRPQDIFSDWELEDWAETHDYIKEAAERSRTIEECKASIREYWFGVSEHGLKLVAILDRLDALAKGDKP